MEDTGSTKLTRAARPSWDPYDSGGLVEGVYHKTGKRYLIRASALVGSCSPRPGPQDD